MGALNELRELQEITTKANNADRSNYSRYVIIASNLNGIALSIISFIFLLPEAKRISIGLFVMPFIIGFMCTAALALTFAPQRVMESDSGVKWRKLVGVKSIFAARLTCALFLIVITAPIAFIFIQEYLEGK